MRSQDITLKEALFVHDHCICLSLQRAARTVGRLFDEALRPLEITNWQFSLLMNLSREQAPTIGELAEALSMDRTTITANLKPLERRGLVEIHRDDVDGRSRRVALTKAGARLLKSAYEIWREANAEALQKVSGLDIAQLRGGLAALAS